jgi:site-specific recombinase XerD
MKEFIPLAYKEVDLPLIKLNYDFLKRYELFLTAEKNCTNNGVMKQIQRLKKITHLAIANEWLDKDPFIKYKIRYDKVDRGYLTLKELTTIENAELNPKLNVVRDYFIFSCYTGLSYIDIQKFTINNLEIDDDGNEWIVINREKTKVQALIPLLPKAKSLLEKYKLIEHKKHGIFPVKSNQKTNDYLKEIAATCSIKKRLSYHIARHSFATTITLSNGVPIETVSKMLGHNRITITQIYSRVLKGKILDDMRGLKKG